MAKQTPTYDEICFSVLVYEFAHVDKKDSEKKIKRKLNYYKAGKYDQERVDYVRKFKEELCTELSSPATSIYYKKAGGEFAELIDFDVSRMKNDLLNKYNQINDSDMYSFINFSIYLYYLR
jgi:hypothetical protein